MNCDETSIIKINPDACTTILDGELVVMNAQDNVYYRINGTGKMIWELLALEPCSVQVIVDFIAQLYSIPKEQIHNDVDMFMNDMINMRFLFADN